MNKKGFGVYATPNVIAVATVKNDMATAMNAFLLSSLP